MIKNGLLNHKSKVWEFSRLNMVNTCLSKRKLKWIVEETNLVSGWDDPRFPTLQGINRRGIIPEGLMKFVLDFGGSKKANLCTWDKLYVTNAKILDQKIPRYQCVNSKNKVK